MDSKALTTNPTISLSGVLKGLENENEAMMSRCLDRKYDAPPCGCTLHDRTCRCNNTNRLFLSFGIAVHADQISNCPLGTVLTYKNLLIKFAIIILSSKAAGFNVQLDCLNVCFSGYWCGYNRCGKAKG